MLQAVMTRADEITFVETPIPEVKPGQIKMKMKRIGICGSDIHVNHGKHPYTSYPVVQGHEVSAEIVEIGADVRGFAVGDKITVQPQETCKECYPCTHGQYNTCENLKVMGFQTTGMASEYFVTEAQKCMKLPHDMSWDHGAMIEPLAVAVHAVRRYGDINGKSVLILGGGPIGNLIGQTVKAMGAVKVLLSEISPYRLGIAGKCGLEVVNSSESDLKQHIDGYFGRDGTDVIFECVGINTTINQAIRYARKGSDIVVVGVFADLETVDMGLVQDRELRLIGTAMYREEDYTTAIALAGQGAIQFDPLITDHVPFREYPKAYEMIDMLSDKTMKIMIVMDE